MPSDTSLVARQVGYEQRMYWRNPASSGFTFVFPVLVLVIFASLNTNERVSFLGNVPYNQYYVPGIIAFSIISACYVGLATTLSIRRDSGVLKRKRGTPLPAWALIAGIVGNAFVVAFIITALVSAIGIVFYDVSLPAGRLPALALTVALGAAAFCVLGVAISSVVPNADASPAITNLTIFPLYFVSGVFFPIDPKVFLAKVGNLFPVRHLVQAIFATFDPRPHRPALATGDLLVLLAWAVVGGIIAVRRFRWEPRASR